MASKPNKVASLLLPYSVIEAATCGNVDAINYGRYIAVLATRTLYDENNVIAEKVSWQSVG